MNNSKKMLKTTTQSKKPSKTISSKTWIIASAVLLVVLIGALLFDQLYKRSILTIEGEKYYMEDLSYYFYGVESQYDYYDQMFGGAYWDMSYDENSGTMRDIAKQEAIETSIYNEILYREAVSKGYTLTGEENDTIATNVESMLEGLTDTVKTKNNFNKKTLTDVLQKTTLVSRYRQDVIDAFDIDDEAIKTEINYDDYRQYDVEYLFVSTETKDEEDKTVAMSEDEKQTAYQQISSYHNKAQNSEDWSDLIPEEEENVLYREESFVETDTTFSEDIEAQIMAMDNSTVSDILEDENGYYIIRMNNNNSSESYDNAVEEAITNKENEEFRKAYEDIKKNYSYSINEGALKSLRMGNITLAN